MGRVIANAHATCSMPDIYVNTRTLAEQEVENMDFPMLIEQCAPDVDPDIMKRIIKVESSFNPYAIGVVGGRLVRQPRNKAEAIATALNLHDAGWNFSMGLGQINRYNLSNYGLDYEMVFEPCHNLRAAVGIYNECLQRAMLKFNADKARLAAFSCYYSGNFSRGFQVDAGMQSSYVQRITATPVSNSENTKPIMVIADRQNKKTFSADVIHDPISKKNDARLSRLPAVQKQLQVKELRGD